MPQLTPEFIQQRKALRLAAFKPLFDAQYQGSLEIASFVKLSQSFSIKCPIHGVVSVNTPAGQFLSRKRGCPKCGMEHNRAGLKKRRVVKQPMPFAEYQARFDEKNKGQVTLLAYTKTGDPVRVLCALHGEFVLPRASSVLRMKVACPECAKALNPLIHARNETYEKALLKFAKQPAGHTIDLNDKTYSGNSPQYKMTCPIHGYRYESLNYLAKRGCSACCGSHMSADAITKFTPIP